MDSEKKITFVSDDDEKVDYESFSKFLNENVDRDKNSIAKQFNEYGEELLAEIDEKNQWKDKVKSKQIKHILKYSKKTYLPRQLNSYSYDDVRDIYNEIKKDNSKLRKAFHFIFNL